MNIVKILKGLPASGKTSIALELEKQGWIRINKDDIREYLGKHKSETRVIKIRDEILNKALDKKRNIVIDDTNLHPKHELSIRKLVGDRAKVEVEFLDVPPQICVERDSKRTTPVGPFAIWSMWNKHIRLRKESDNSELSEDIMKT